MVEAVQPKRVTFDFPQETQQKIPQQLPESSIKRSEKKKESFQPSKPVLDMPILGAIENVVNYEGLADRLASLREKSIEDHFANLQKNHIEEAKLLDEALEVSRDVTFWSILEDMGSMFMGAISTVFGFSLLSSGAGSAAGGALIASGVLAISNITFKHAEVWSWVADQVSHDNQTLRQAIATYIPASLGILAAGLGIYGGVASWAAGAVTGTNKAMAIIQTTAAIAGGFAALGEGLADSALKRINGALSVLQFKAETLRIDLENVADEVKEFYKRQLEMEELAAQLVRETNAAIQTTHQAV